MKLRIFFLSLLFTIIASQSFAQKFSKLDEIPLNENADYKKAEKVVLECDKYLTSTPLNNNDSKRNAAEKFINKWMSGTPDYTFNIDYSLAQIVGNNSHLLGVYLAYYSKYAIENEGKADDDELMRRTLTSFIDYCKKPANKVDQTDILKKFIEQQRDSRFQEL